MKGGERKSSTKICISSKIFSDISWMNAQSVLLQIKRQELFYNLYCANLIMINDLIVVYLGIAIFTILIFFSMSLSCFFISAIVFSALMFLLPTSRTAKEIAREIALTNVCVCVQGTHPTLYIYIIYISNFYYHTEVADLRIFSTR